MPSRNSEFFGRSLTSLRPEASGNAETAMNRLLRLLYLEDDIADAELARDTLELDGFVCDVSRVETESGFRAALQHCGVDVILADDALPSFDGLSALKITLGQRPDLPFIFVSGTMGEEVAIEAL